MTTLYDRHKAEWDKLASEGRPHVAQMAKHFARAADMDRALGLEAATAHWANGRNGVAMKNEIQAKQWLESLSGKASPQAPVSSREGTVLMVVCDATKAERVQKVLALLGCEVVEV